MPEKQNGSTPPESLYFERTQLKCFRCKRNYEHFIIEQIDDLKQLRCGDLVITEIEMTCLHCGHVFTWDARRKDLSKMAIKYGELVDVIKGYNPE